MQWRWRKIHRICSITAAGS